MTELLKELNLGRLDWKGLVLAGLCPSLIFSFGLIFCLQGPDGITSTLESAYRSFPALAAKSTPFLAANLVFAFLLYALRPVILHFYRRAPIPPLRELMLRLSAWKRERADKKLQIAVWRLDVARWLQSGFQSDTFVAPVVVDAQKESPVLAETVPKSKEVRGWIAEDSAMQWRSHRRSAFSIFEKLHLLAAQRTRVQDKAAELAKEPGRTDAQNWAKGEEFLDIKAPGDELTEELEAWRNLCRGSLSIQNRAKDFDDYLLHGRHRDSASALGDYPNAVWIEPTRLGNIFAALEDYAEKRYGMDTAQLWSRLEAIVPKQQREQIAGYQMALSSLLNANLALCLLAVFAVVIGVGAHDWREWAFAACSFAAAYLCQRAALYSASGLREKIEAAVDLNVLRWLRSLGSVPPDADARFLTIQQLGNFFKGGSSLPADFKFAAVAEPASEDKKKD
jgi:hypothetical protein